MGFEAVTFPGDQNPKTFAIAACVGFDPWTLDGAEMKCRSQNMLNHEISKNVITSLSLFINMIQCLNHGYNIETFVKVHLSIGEKPSKKSCEKRARIGTVTP